MLKGTGYGHAERGNHLSIDPRVADIIRDLPAVGHSVAPGLSFVEIATKLYKTGNTRGQWNLVFYCTNEKPLVPINE